MTYDKLPCVLLASFTVLFCGQSYETVQNRENMGKNRTPKSSRTSAIGATIMPALLRVAKRFGSRLKRHISA
jgi:hypothetical protein